MNQELKEAIEKALNTVRYGEVTLIVHDEKVTRIDTKNRDAAWWPGKEKEYEKSQRA